MKWIISDVLRSLIWKLDEAQTPKYVQDLVLFHHSSTAHIRLLYGELMSEYKWLDCILKKEDEDTLNITNIAVLFSHSEDITFLLNDDETLSEQQCASLIEDMVSISAMTLDITICFVWSTMMPQLMKSRITTASVHLYGTTCRRVFDSKSVSFNFSESNLTVDAQEEYQSRIESMIESLSFIPPIAPTPITVEEEKDDMLPAASNLKRSRNAKRIEVMSLAIFQSDLGSVLPVAICTVIATYGQRFVNTKILSVDEQDDLLEMVEKQLQQQELELAVVYRGSRDGFNIQPFLDKSKGIPNTIMVIHSDHGTKFGGYTQVPWSDDQQYHDDKTAFLYQLRPECKVFPLLEGKEQWAVHHRTARTFPFFGNWGELVLYPDCNLNQNSNCYIASGRETFDFKGNEVCGGDAHPISARHFGFKVLEVELVALLSQNTIDYIVENAKREHSNKDMQYDAIQKTLEVLYDKKDAELITMDVMQ